MYMNLYTYVHKLKYVRFCVYAFKYLHVFVHVTYIYVYVSAADMREYPDHCSQPHHTSAIVCGLASLRAHVRSRVVFYPCTYV